MPLKLKDISSCLSFAKKLSNTSEEILKKTPSNRIKINFKSDKSPVTKIDMEIERKLRSMINKRFPGVTSALLETYDLNSINLRRLNLDPNITYFQLGGR